MNLTPKELKAMKKDELVRLVISMRDSNTPPQKRKLSLSENSDNLTRVTPSPSSDRVSLNISEIKSAVFEAVNDIKTELRFEFMTMLKDLKDEFTTEIVKIRDELQDHKMKNNSSLQDVESEFLRDIQDVESRKNNLMIFGIMESDEKSIDLRKQSDLKKIERLAAEINVQFSEPQSVIRLGRISDKPRPIKLVGLSSKTREALLQSAPQIRSIDGSLGLNRVFIKPDLTLKQQLIERNLRAELKTRREKGENVRLRNGIIISLSKNDHLSA